MISAQQGFRDVLCCCVDKVGVPRVRVVVVVTVAVTPPANGKPVWTVRLVTGAFDVGVLNKSPVAKHQKNKWQNHEHSAYVKAI